VKVLLIRLSSLGDVILATAAVEALQAEVPGAEVDVLTKPSFREVFRGHGGVRRTLPWEEGRLGALAKAIRAGQYEWIVDLHANLRTRVLRLLVPGSRWSVYRKGALRRRLGVLARRPALLGDRHVLDRYRDALLPLGLSAVEPQPRLCPGEPERAAVDERLRRAGWDGRCRVVALGPGARWPTKAWPAEHWVELLRGLTSEGAFPALVGGVEDRDLPRLLGRAGVPGASFVGSGILESAAVLARSAVLVTNDSAPLHMAVAVGTPVVALFGPTVRGFGFSPRGPRDVVLERDLPCRPCSLHGGERCPRGDHRCLREIAPAEVLQALGEVAP
jgi:heptosyltransferase II